ncbi:MAG: hypothetical protein ABIF77_03160, partial [bacterium]
MNTESVAHCRNCGAELHDRYCHRCGQDSRELPIRTVPLLLVGLVAASAGLMGLLFRRERFLTHTIFALHWCAFYFVVEGLRQILPIAESWETRVSIFTMSLATIYLSFAMRK